MIFVFDRLELFAFTAFPSVLLPVDHPLGAAFGDVGAVGHDEYCSAASQSVQAGDHRLEFHLVVGCLGSSAGEFFFLSGAHMPENTTPAARTGVPAAGPVRKQHDLSFGRRSRFRHDSAPAWQ